MSSKDRTNQNNPTVNRYKPSVLENNWNEERFDINNIKQLKPINQTHETTYTELTRGVDQVDWPINRANLIKINRSSAYPGHQPEINFREPLDTYETDYRVNYLDPRLKTFPVNLNKMFADDFKGKNSH